MDPGVLFVVGRYIYILSSRREEWGIKDQCLRRRDTLRVKKCNKNETDSAPSAGPVVGGVVMEGV